MIIESIKIENFRQYKGPIKIDLDFNENKNFTIIQGTNGAGKTNLLNAITWCLYGKELHKANNSKSKQVYNQITANEVSNNETFNVRVEIVFRDKDDNKITVIRNNPYMGGDSPIQLKSENDFKVLFNSTGNDEPLKRPSTFIEKNLPIAIEGYFFFDGEKLEDYFDANSGSTIKDAVFDISQLNLFENLEINLDKCKKEFSKEISKINKDVGNITEEKNNYEAKMRNAENKINEANVTIEECDSKIETLESEYADLNRNDVDKIRKDIGKLKNDNEYIEKKLSKFESQKADFIISMIPCILGYDLINNVVEKCNELDDKGELDPKYQKAFLADILDKKKCICGNDLSEHKEAYEVIKSLLNETSDLTNIAKKINDVAYDLKQIQKQMGKFDKERKRYNGEIKTLSKRLKENNEELEDLEMKMIGIDDTRIRRITIDLKDLKRIRDKAVGDMRIQKDIYHRSKEELEKIKLKEDKISDNNKNLKSLRENNSFTEKALNISRELANIVTNSIRENIQELTTEQFKKLMWKENFSEVLIDSGYNVSLKDITGSKHDPSILSAGEKLVLALSFVSALNNKSGFDLPFIIDTPMGRLDSEMKNNIANTLPNYVDGKQVILVVTGEEYNENFKNGIKDKVNKEFRIEVNETENGTESKVI